MNSRHLIVFCLALLVLPMLRARAEDLSAAVSPERLREIHEAVDRGLEWLSKHQNENGSFQGGDGAHSYSTSYAVLAYLSRGHQPGQGRYGRQLSRAIDFILTTQRADGSFSTRPPEQMPEKYTHALSGLALSEAYGSTTGAQSERMRQAIERALVYSRTIQQAEKFDPLHVGGWYYFEDKLGEPHTDSSFTPDTAWELTFLRSAHKAGFKVPQNWVDEGLEFVARCYQPGPGVSGDRRDIPVLEHQATFICYPTVPPNAFTNSGHPPRIWANHNTTAAGMLAFQLHGRRDDPRVLKAGDWIAEQPIPVQKSIPRFYYGCYVWSQVMAQLGGKHWNSFFPRLADRLLPHQDADGHWRLDQFIGYGGEDQLGPAYYTSLAILCLTLPDQLLPVHQR